MNRTTTVAAGLLVAWAVHDAEEVLTYRKTSRQLAARAPAWLPLPADVRQHGVGAAEIGTGVAVMGTLMAVATVDGIRSKGQGLLFQRVLRGFGWHGVGHIAMSLLARGYVTGLVTSPAVVLPYWVWARRELRRHGIEVPLAPGWEVLALVPVIVGAHAAARRLTGVAGRPMALGADA